MEVISQRIQECTVNKVIAARATAISFFDHIIIGDNRYFSFADEGLIGEYKAVAIREL
jgi:DNA repair protein RadC